MFELTRQLGLYGDQLKAALGGNDAGDLLSSSSIH